MDPDLEGGVGDEGGKWGGGAKGTVARTTLKGGTSRGPLSLFLGGGDKEALASFPSLSRRCHIGSANQLHSTKNTHKDDNDK